MACECVFVKEKERERIRDKDMKTQRIREAGREIEECIKRETKTQEDKVSGRQEERGRITKKHSKERRRWHVSVCL